MKFFLKFIAILLVILLVSAFLAPLLFKFLPFKIGRIFNRLVMIGTLVAIFLFVRIKKETLKSYGLFWTGESLPLWLKAFLAAFSVLSVLMFLKIMAGEAVWSLKDLGGWGWTARFALSFGAALLIGVIEEFFFRGFVFSTFKDKFKWPIFFSVIVTSVFYSLIHFVSVKRPFIGADPTFLDGLKLAAAPLWSLTEIASFWPAALGLFIFGLILNDLVIRTGSLYPAIGLHGGCVFFLKLDGAFTNILDTNVFHWGTKDVYDGMAGWIFLLLLWLLVRRLFRKVPNPS